LSKKYDLNNLNPKLLSPPPHSISNHPDKEEVINFILDKCFVMI